MHRPVNMTKGKIRTGSLHSSAMFTASSKPTMAKKASAVAAVMAVKSTRGKKPGRGELRRLQRTGLDPTCSHHVGFGDACPFGPVAGRAGGPGRAAAGGERCESAAGLHADRCANTLDRKETGGYLLDADPHHLEAV